jgi:hypothetical protein
VAVHRWVGEAWTASGRTARLLHATWTSSQLDRFGLRLEGVFMTDGRPAGVREEDLAVHLRLDGVALDRKVAALRAMATQTTEAVARVGVETFAAQVDEECFVEVAR